MPPINRVYALGESHFQEGEWGPNGPFARAPATWFSKRATQVKCNSIGLNESLTPGGLAQEVEPLE